MKNTNAVIYTRAALQSEQGLEEQLKSCRELSARNNFEVVGEYSDIGSGMTGQRNDLQRMIEELGEKDARFVIVHGFDRISRDSRNFMLLKDDFKRRGVGLLSVTEGDTSSPINNIFESVLESKGAESLE